MKVKIIAVARGEQELEPKYEAKVREALDNPTEVRRVMGPVTPLMFETIVSLFEDDGTFIRSYEY